MYLTHPQLDSLVHAIRDHSQLAGNVGRKIRRFLAQVMPGDTLLVDLCTSTNPRTEQLLAEHPLAFPNLDAAAHRLPESLMADNEYLPETLAVKAELLQPEPGSRVLILGVRVGHRPVELLSVRELQQMLEVAADALARCKAFLDRFAGYTEARLCAFGLDPSEPFQDLALKVAQAARDNKALPDGVSVEKLPVCLFGILEAYGLGHLAEAALAVDAN